MAQSKSTLTAALKNDYGPGLKNALNNLSALTTEFNVNERDVVGEKAVWALHSGRSSSGGARAEGAVLPTGDRQRYTSLSDNIKYDYQTVKLTGPAKALTKNNTGAFIRALEAEMDGAKDDAMFRRARQLLGQAKTDGTDLKSGVITVLSADPGTGTTLTMATASRAEMRTFFINQSLRVINPTGGAARTGTYVVTAVDLDAKTLTIDVAADAGIASGDYVVDGDANGNGFGNEINGLRHLISTQKTAGVDPASVPSWGSVTNGSSTTAISEVLLNESSEKVYTEGNGSVPNLWVCEPDQRRKLASALQAQKRYDGMQTKLKAGWKGLDIAEGVLVAERFCPTVDIFGITTKDIERFVAEDWDWDDDDGDILFKALDGSDGIQARFKTYDQLAATNRNSHVRVTVATPTF